MIVRVILKPVLLQLNRATEFHKSAITWNCDIISLRDTNCQRSGSNTAA